jgi:hypothetical protein
MGRSSKVTSFVWQRRRPTGSIFGEIGKNAESRVALADTWSSEILFRVVYIGFEVVEVLTRICSLVFARFDEPEEAGCKKRSEEGTNPINPMLGRE